MRRKLLFITATAGVLAGSGIGAGPASAAQPDAVHVYVNNGIDPNGTFLCRNVGCKTNDVPGPMVLLHTADGDIQVH